MSAHRVVLLAALAAATSDVTRGQTGSAAAGASAQPAAPASAASTSGAKPNAAELAEAPAPWHGWIGLQARSRWTSDEQDHDAYANVSVEYGRTGTNALTARVYGRLTADLDGREQQTSVFRSLADTRDGSVEGLVYHAYLDYAPKDGAFAVRAGRQLDTRTPELLHFDGVLARTQPTGAKALEFGVYGGVPVHLYESSSGDSALGTYAEGRPWKGGRARVDWMHVDDEDVLGDRVNDLMGLGLWQRVDAWSAEVQYSRLEEESRDLRVRAQHTDEACGAVARATYYELFETQRARALEFDPFTSALQDFFPYRQFGASYSRPIGRHVDLDLGADARRVRDDADVGEFNRDWERWRATGTVHDFGVRGLALSVTADRWDGDGTDTSTWGADATLEPSAPWRFSLGSEYALYKYDLFGESERDDVRTWYLRAKCKATSALTLDLAYEYEDTDSDTYQFLRWGASWRF
ncbi:MAG: hypothetical protein IPJ77_21720 [Planctomycetes bacterium]|nr:hypothetical protein [Planctomycetota bacterium]